MNPGARAWQPSQTEEMRTADDMRFPALLLALTAFCVVGAPGYAREVSRSTAKQPTSSTAASIVVTANKRRIPLIEAPVSLTFVSADDLDNVFARDLSDLSGLIPSLRSATFANPANTDLIIRGVGNGAFNPGIEPSVGVFIDGIYRSRAPATLADLPPIERVEVLRGPQTSLFGKNASAGVISIITKAPEFLLAGRSDFSLGNYQARSAALDLTGPISQHLAFRISGSLENRDGYGRAPNLGTRANDRDRQSVRLQLSNSPNPDLQFRLIADFDEINENCCLVTNVAEGPSAALIENLGGKISAGSQFSDTYFINFPSENHIKNSGVSLDISTSSLGFSIRSLTAFRRNVLHSDQDSDFTSADLLGKNSESRHTETFTQELRIEGSHGKTFDFLLGGFLMRESIRQRDVLQFGTQFRDYASELIASLSGGLITTPQLEALSLGTPGVGTFWLAGQGTNERYRLRNTAFTLFASTGIRLSDRLKLTLGMAYNDDRKASGIALRTTDVFSAVDLIAVGRNATISNAVGSALGLGRPATASEIGAFKLQQPTAFATIDQFAGINAGVLPAEALSDDNPQTTVGNPLLGLRALQFVPPFLDYPNAIEDGKTHDSDWSWSAEVAYKLSENVNLQARYATGFKASSINLTRDSRPFVEDFIPGSPAQIPLPQPSPIRSAGLNLVNLTTGTRFAEPEHSEVWEVGTRAQWNGGWASLSYFDQRIKNFQTMLFLGTGFALGNAQRESVKGFEFESSTKVNRNVWLNGAITRLTAKYNKFENAQVVGSQAVDLSGMNVAGVPRFSASVGAGYSRNIGKLGSIQIYTNFTYSSSVRIRQDLPDYKRETSSVDASVSWRSSTRNVEVSLWGRNILDDRWLVQVFPGVLQPGTVSGYPNEPRTFGSGIRIWF